MRSPQILIVEPCFFGELLVEAALAVGVAPVLFTCTAQRQAELTSRWTTIATHVVDTSSVCDMHDALALFPRVQAIVSGTEHYIATVGELIEASGLRGPIGAQTGRRARFKDEMRLALSDAGLPQPGYAIYDAEAAVARHFTSPSRITSGMGTAVPAVFKPSWLGGSWGVKKVATDSDTFSALTELSTLYLPFPFNRPLDHRVFLMEHYVQADMEVSVEVYRRNGQTQFFGVTEKHRSAEPYFIEIGHVHSATRLTVPESVLRDTVDETLDAIGIRNGAAHCEVLLCDGQCCIVECAARNGGDRIMHLVEAATGVNLPLCCVCGVLGRTEPVQRTKQRAAAIQFVTPSENGRWAVQYDPTVLLDSQKVAASLPPAGSIVEVSGAPNVMSRVGFVSAVADRPEAACAAARSAARTVEFVRVH